MTAPPAAPLRVSPIDAAQDAIEHTRRQLFPFRFERWLALGFVAFLDQCGRSGGFAPGGGSGWHGGGEGGGGGGGPDLTQVVAWVSDHVGLLVLLAALGLSLVVALAALVLWVNTRGIFMYLDDVVTGRADVARPWREHAERAGSLFAWRFGLALATLVGVVLLLLLGAGAFVAVARGGVTAGVGVAFGLLVLLPLFLLLALASGLASVALRDFVAPLQLLGYASCGEAVAAFLALLRAQPWVFVLYVLLKIVFQIAAGVILLAVCCLCCCVLLPIVCQTALQPLFYFERAWSVFLLRRFGHDLLARGPEALQMT